MRPIKTMRWLPVLLLATAMLAAGAEPEVPSEADQHAVRVFEKREGNLIRLMAQPLQLAAVTITLKMDLVNMQPCLPLPRTVVCQGNQPCELVSVQPTNPHSKWHYDYGFKFMWGSPNAKHDASVVYTLPYASGKRFRVCQGFNGQFSHTDINQYAVDWEMKPGSEIHAARDGQVVAVKDDSSTGGNSVAFKRYANFVLIRQPDGTYAEYLHFLKDGLRVKPGQQLKAGELIGLSGETGYTDRPHLHFCVFRAIDGDRRETFPVRFQTATKPAVIPVEGETYTAP